MTVEPGWVFMSADFSTVAYQREHGERRLGTVTLVRATDDRLKWHNLPDEIKESNDCPELFVAGHGITFESALMDANKKAYLAKPIYN